ncbi:immunity protein YezG family protein [Paenibacillus sp. NPDC057886]|uniref:immunity protein YezG family protein n=1 Tax=Paenibacillus sp. NPDC057886 TaxID=3346270 RepID=UPI0036A1520B
METDWANAFKEDPPIKVTVQIKPLYSGNSMRPDAFTLSLDSTGKFNINFDYTNWYKTDYGFSDQLKIWKYKYLNISQMMSEVNF